MRIIAGKCGGRRIDPPKGLDVRPTTDIAKEALFNILNNRIDIEGIKMLDLCCGTGNIGLEFASRGAEMVTAVDINRKCVAFVRQTADKLGLPVQTELADLIKFLSHTKQQWEVIFCDLPFELAKHEAVVKTIFDRNLLHPDGLLIIEHGPRTDLSGLAQFQENRAYGKVRFSFFACSEAEHKGA